MTERYKEAYNKFSTIFKAIKDDLTAYIITKGGTIDNHGYIIGLDENISKYVEKTNKRLEILSEYSNEAELCINDLMIQNHKLKGKIRLLENATREKLHSDEYVLNQINRLLNFRIEDETLLSDFEGTLRDTVYYFELGLKRKLIVQDDKILSKLDWAKWFLKSETDMKRHYYKKKNELYETHESIKSAFNQ